MDVNDHEFKTLAQDVWLGFRCAAAALAVLGLAVSLAWAITAVPAC